MNAYNFTKLFEYLHEELAVVQTDSRHSSLEAQHKQGDEQAHAQALAMVISKARRQGYKYKGYHGSNSKIKFYIFDPNRRGERTGAKSARMGFFAVLDKDVAEQYKMTPDEREQAGNLGPLMFNLEDAERNLEWAEQAKAFAEYDEDIHGWVAKVKAYDQWGTPFDYDANDVVYDSEKDAVMAAWDVVEDEIALAAETVEHKAGAKKQTLEKELTERVLHGLFIRLEKPLVYDFDGGTYMDKSYSELVQQALDEGRDGVVMLQTDDTMNQKGDIISDVYVFFQSSQAKLTDPFTYDDQGALIPLSKRFDFGEEDIRY